MHLQAFKKVVQVSHKKDLFLCCLLILINEIGLKITALMPEYFFKKSIEDDLLGAVLITSGIILVIILLDFLKRQRVAVLKSRLYTSLYRKADNQLLFLEEKNSPEKLQLHLLDLQKMDLTYESLLFRLIPGIFNICLVFILVCSNFWLFITVSVMVSMFLLITRQVNHNAQKEVKKFDDCTAANRAVRLECLENGGQILNFGSSRTQIKNILNVYSGKQHCSYGSKWYVYNVGDLLKNLLFWSSCIVSFCVLASQPNKIITFGIIFLQLKSGLDQLSSGIVFFSQFVPSINYVHSLLNPKQKKSTTRVYSKLSTLKIDNLNVYSPNGNKLLSNVKIKLQGPKFVVITGKSGCGKSTLAQYIAFSDFTQIESGRVLYIPQAVHCFEQFSWRTNLGAPSHLSDSEIINLITRVGLSDRFEISGGIDEPVGKLSGGQLKRLAIGRVLSSLRPGDVVLLDEPATGLDSGSLKEFLNILVQISKTNLLLVVSHKKEVLEMADYVWSVENEKNDTLIENLIVA